MSDLTRAQRVRLGLFLVLAAGVFALVLAVKLGPQLFGATESYHVRGVGGVGGLEAGAQVTFNGIAVGRVDSVALDPDDIAVVIIGLALDEGTPVPADATATVVMQGITGQRYVELGGGTHGARRRDPGEAIPMGASVFDEIGDRARVVADQLGRLLDDVHAITSGPDMARVWSIVRHAESAAARLDALVAQTAPHVDSLVARVDHLAGALDGLVGDTRATLGAVRTSAASLATTVARVADRDVGPLLARLDRTAERTDQLVARADGLVGVARADLHAVVDALVRGLDSVAELAEMLRANPTSLVFGRSAAPRELP